MSKVVELSPDERLQLIQILPQQAKSLKESVQLNRLRKDVSFSDEERDTLDIGEGGQFDPRKLSELSDKEVKLSDDAADLVAYAMVQREQEEEVPTSDAMVNLITKFGDEIERVKGDDE